MKRFAKFALVAVIAVNVGLAAAALPKALQDRIVDKIMDFGDKHFGGPFKKGGGDEAATRQVISDRISPEKAWRVFFDVTLNSDSSTATAEQDKPGWTPEGPSAPVPQGQPAPSNQAPPTAAPVPVAGNTQGSAAPQGNHDGSVGPPDHGMTHASNDAPAANANSAATAPGPTKTIELKAGENTWAQATTNPNINPNPELTGGGSSAPASSPAPSPSPAPVATPQPAAAPAPTPAPAPAPIQRQREGPAGHEGGHQGGYTGPDGHSSQVDHAGHIS